MKNHTTSLLKITALAVATAFGTSCSTTYDAYGQPRQSVDPGLAIAGVAAAGLVGYAIANNKNDNRKYHRNHSDYRRSDYRRSNYRHSGYKHYPRNSYGGHQPHYNRGYRY